MYRHILSILIEICDIMSKMGILKCYYDFFPLEIIYYFSIIKLGTKNWIIKTFLKVGWIISRMKDFTEPLERLTDTKIYFLKLLNIMKVKTGK